MSCIVWPRTLSGLCSPSAQSTASVTFDLPQPFGPTITLTPGEKTSLVRSGKDLKPLMVIELRCMVVQRRFREASRARPDANRVPTSSPFSASAAAACSAAFFERPEPWPTASPLTLAATSKTRSCGGPDSPVTSYRTRRPARARRSCSADLKSSRRSEAISISLRERGHRRLGGDLEAVVQIAGADHRLADRGQRPLGGEQRLDVDPAVEPSRGRLGEQLGDAELDRDLGAGPPADRLAVHLRQPADVGARVAAEEVLGERQAEHAVAEEGEPAVGVGAVLDPGGVGERLAAQGQRQRVEQLAERLGPRCRLRRRRAPTPAPPAEPADAARHRSRPAGARTTKSTASPTVAIRDASSSETLTP